MIQLKRLPIPPSANKQLTLSKGRFIKQKDARIFDGLISKYALVHFKTIESGKDLIKQWLDQGLELQIELLFVFKKDRVITKTKKAKSPYRRIDSNNRIKSSIDAVSKLFEIDDMLFFKETSEKLTCDNDKDEQLIVTIKPYIKRTLNEL